MDGWTGVKVSLSLGVGTDERHISVVDGWTGVKVVISCVFKDERRNDVVDGWTRVEVLISYVVTDGRINDVVNGWTGEHVHVILTMSSAIQSTLPFSVRQSHVSISASFISLSLQYEG